MLQSRQFFFFLLIFMILFFSACSKNPETSSFTAMNTYMTVKSYGPHAKAANQQIQKEIERLEGILSTTIDKSDVWKINNSLNNSSSLNSSWEGAGNSVKVHDETKFLIEQSQEFYELTGGAFNPALYPVIREWGFTTGDYKVPKPRRIRELLELTDFSEVKVHSGEVYKPAGLQLDFGAIGKGYAGDKAIELLRAAGVSSALLDFGGNIQVLGRKPNGSDWTVGIKNPWGGEPVAAVKLRDKCMITSGGYERFFTASDGHRYIHIFDGTTGYPVENELESVTIICSQGIYGDALSTSLFVMGLEKAVEFWHSAQDFDFVILTKDKRIIYSAPLQDSISITSSFRGEAEAIH